MNLRKILSICTCGLLAVALAAGCSKVREPADQAPGQPAVVGQAQDAQAPQGPAPAIACDKPDHDFGTIAQGEEAVHTFVIKNTGKGPLKIERARGG